MSEIKIGICSNRLLFWSSFISETFSYLENPEEDTVVRVFQVPEVVLSFGLVEDLDYLIVDKNPYEKKDNLFKEISRIEKRGIKVIIGENAYE